MKQPPIRRITALLIGALSLAVTRHGDAQVGKITRIDPGFDRIAPPDAKIERVAGNFQWSEGPVWHPDGYLLFSDLMENAIMKWTPDGGVVPFRKPVFQGR